MSIIIKRWADPAIPFYYMRYYLNLRFETFHKQMPNIQIDVCQIKLHAQSIYSSPPLLKWLTHGKLFIFDQQPRHLLEGSEFNFKILPNIGLKVAAESRTAESPIVNIFAKTIFEHFQHFEKMLDFERL